jgi:hypothetical protein
MRHAARGILSLLLVAAVPALPGTEPDAVAGPDAAQRAETEKALKDRLAPLLKTASTTTTAAGFSTLTPQLIELANAALLSDAFDTADRSATAAVTAAQASGEGCFRSCRPPSCKTSGRSGRGLRP